MRRGIYAGVAFIILLAVFCPAVASTVRQPAAAGSFYPADKDQLAFQVAKFLAGVPTAEITGEPIALIVPHAGYPFSGQVAAFAYKQLTGRPIDTVILIGASHHLSFNEIAVPDCDYFETPLGRVPVDQEFIARLKKLSDRVVINDKAHEPEHALEVQLPFLQATLKDFKIVPILFGNISLANCQSLAYALNLLIEPGTLVIASSDWSHYYSYEMAHKLDSCGIGEVMAGDLPGFIRSLSEGGTEACGAPAIITAVLLAPALGANRVELLKYANSGDVTGDKSNVVGYAAIIFYHQPTVFSDADKAKLLRIARRTLTAQLSGKKLPQFNLSSGPLTEDRGVFVTLTENEQLRGCIGYNQPVKPLYQAVQELVVAAALHDARFEPVTKDELQAVKIEISVLSRLSKVKDVNEIEIGRDGLYIIKGDNSGLLLPQVVAEWGWDREEFLKQVCIKAGLLEDAWKSKDASLYRFTAEIFHE